MGEVSIKVYIVIFQNILIDVNSILKTDAGWVAVDITNKS